MKTKLVLFATICLTSFFACKKSTTQPTTSSTTNNNTTTPTPTMSIEFFVNANKHQIREPYDYPAGSPMFSDASSPFTGLASGDVCTTTGKSLTVKYSTVDTTAYTIWFYTAATPNDIYRGTAELKITKAGAIILNYSSFTGAVSANCVKAIIME